MDEVVDVEIAATQSNDTDESVVSIDEFVPEITSPPPFEAICTSVPLNSKDPTIQLE